MCPILSRSLRKGGAAAAQSLRSGPVRDMRASIFGIRGRLLRSVLSRVPLISAGLSLRFFSLLHLRDTQIVEVGLSHTLRSGLYQLLAYSRGFASGCSSLRRSKGVHLRVRIGLGRTNVHMFPPVRPLLPLLAFYGQQERSITIAVSTFRAKSRSR